ncbi:MAG: isochorismatase family cysteine hydrolase, partial [Actinomycetota bacterium]
MCDAASVLHDWHIEPREYARHEQRRGRRHAFSELRPERTAVVVVDMVPFFVEQNDYALGIVPNTQRLVGALRSLSGTVAWVLPSADAPTAARVEFLGAKVAGVYRTSAGAGPLRSRLWREFEVDDADLVVQKASASAFFPGHCDLPTLLDRRDVDTVLITGTVANVCCESSARDASALGYRVVMIADALAALRDDDLNATLHTVYRSFGDVRSTDDVIALLQGRSVGWRPPPGGGRQTPTAEDPPPPGSPGP